MHLKRAVHTALRGSKPALALVEAVRRFAAVTGVMLLSLQAGFGFGIQPAVFSGATAQVLEGKARGRLLDLDRAANLAGYSILSLAEHDGIPGWAAAPGPRNYSDDLLNWHARDVILLALAVLGLGWLALRSARSLVRGQVDFRNPAPANAGISPGNPVTTEPLAEEFFAAFRVGPISPAPAGAAEAPVMANNRPAEVKEQPPAEVSAPTKFSDWAPRHVSKSLSLFREVSRSTDAGERQRMLVELSRQLGSVKERAGEPGLLPLWQMACALEGLLKQLAGKESNVTASTLQTAAGGLDLLHRLCVQGMKPELATQPPVRLLAVDDDAVSRRALSVALKKAFAEPDLEANGEAGFARATRHAYDVIFLDVEMPGMDGFELCSKIHTTPLNRTTPVVFVTRHSDFDSRAKGALSGGQHLIGKPFLALEITVKALTLVLGARQERGLVNPLSVQKSAELALPAPSTVCAEVPGTSVSSGALASAAESQVGQAKTTTAREGQPGSEGQLRPKATPPLPPSSPPAAPGETVGKNHGGPGLQAGGKPLDFAGALVTHAPAHLESLKSQLHALRQTQDLNVQQELLGQLYIGVHSFAKEAERAELRAAQRLGCALAALLQKLLERPDFCRPSTLNAAAAAIELLEELCAAGVEPGLAEPPARILVVDDDPITLRAIAGAIQLVFTRPESAESGEAALALATEQAFDLIFLDVRMPGMDGFTTCTRIHQTKANTRTPIVFVTSHSDLESRGQAAVSGGCGFIPKPVLGKEIILTALTYIFRGRLTNPSRTGPARRPNDKPGSELSTDSGHTGEPPGPAPGIPQDKNPHSPEAGLAVLARDALAQGCVNEKKCMSGGSLRDST